MNQTLTRSKPGRTLIAVASGKGGTGKTTIAASLAREAADQGLDAGYLDCDVEEPNGHIFLKPEIRMRAPVLVNTPVIDQSKCALCGECRDICRYNAMAVLHETVLAFPSLCHGCGGCALVCPTGSITETGREIGVVEEGTAEKVRFVQGRLRISEAMPVPLIKEVKKRSPGEGVVVVDSPPGTSCPVIESIRGADYVLLVTEPTPFGLNDLKLAIEMLGVLDLPFGVVINRAGEGEKEVLEYCGRRSIDVLLRVPDDIKVAKAYSTGELAAHALPYYREMMASLLKGILNVRP